jgi:hypothetical protein
MRVFDILYYSVYRFGRSIGQPHLQAKACAGGFVPAFFVLVGLFLPFTLVYKSCPTMLPHKDIKPGLVGALLVALIISYIIYVKKGRGKQIISEYEQSKNQKLYLWLGAIFSVVTVSCPVWMGFLWVAVQ